ncbi:MAG TPA: UDP-N-acetylenolpyruvoylglucosamine reductase [Rhodospirillaceae bacterium]|nr:MAG: UDP-N-acetylenolpyruvoylglucosamine reductase [Alphaproteobacteria bacterium GWF2_58_20]HAU30004.1 UDP-N-acetylenolpyruvoylglucosamine reductase [Rhodospirillaceae bacterium]
MTGHVAKLPPVRGRLLENVPMAQRSWLKVGGPVDVLFTPDGEDDLMSFLAACPKDIPLTVIGATSNLLIRDGGIRGVAIQLGKAFSGIHFAGATIAAGAGASCAALSEAAAKAGISGFEFLSGIPGLIGGALFMNAGAYGQDIAGILTQAIAVDREGQRHELSPHAMHFSYRQSQAGEGFIFTHAVFRGHPDETSEIRARMAEMKAKREATQPIHEATAGSTFKNPPGMRAWELIERAGCADMRVGDAHLSPLHRNFMINGGKATAFDCETLGEEVRRKVQEKTGISLEWEVRIVGDAT